MRSALYPARFVSLAAILASVVLLAACGGGGSSPTPAVAEGCNALGSAYCLLPWPSSIYETSDSASPTGRRLDIPTGVLPINGSGVRPDPTRYNAMDGWSANIPLLMAWDTGFDPAPLPPPTDPQKSLDPSSPTVIIDLETGARVPHFAEQDIEAKELEYAAPAQVALILRPLVRLRPGKRYAVAIRNTLKAPGGGALPIAAGFRALLDGTPSGNPRVERVRAGYDEIFSKLAAAGVARSELVVAWDFIVRTDEPVYRDLLDGRNAMLAAIGDGTGWTFDPKADLPGANPAETLRTVEGTFEVPNLLTGDGGDDAVLYRGSDGRVAVNPDHPRLQVPFVVTIPACAATAPLPLPIVVFGHGLVGSTDEAKESYVRHFAQRECYAIVATNWRGMSTPDLNTVGVALGDIDAVDVVMEKLVQGVNQFVALETLARLQWAKSLTFTLNNDAQKPLFDPTQVYFYGISQGSIFGGSFMAIDPFITRGVLGVPAANFSMIIERSTNWGVYRTFLYRAYTENPIDPQILLTLAQTRWDLTDSITHASHLTGDVDARYPGFPDASTPVPRKRVLMQMAVGDSSVNNLGAELFARTAGFKVLEPELYPPFEIASQAGPVESALTQWDEHRLPRPPGGNWTPDENGTHTTLRERDKINDQIQHFFATGDVVSLCKMGDLVVASDCTTDEVCGPPQF